MKKTTKVKLLIYPVFVIIMAFTFVEYSNFSVFAVQRTCCIYGQDCPETGGYVCCEPGTGQAPCSKLKANYCRTGASCY